QTRPAPQVGAPGGGSQPTQRNATPNGEGLGTSRHMPLPQSAFSTHDPPSGAGPPSIGGSPAQSSARAVSAWIRPSTARPAPCFDSSKRIPSNGALIERL